jgi:hypothetical protein
VEILLRCALPDRPGALAEVTGVVAATGADIESVEVVDADDGTAFDDLVVVVRDPGHLKELVAELRELAQVEVVHAAVSRGHPGDAVTRLAVGVEAILTAAMPMERGVSTLLGGLLLAEEVAFVAAGSAPAAAPRVLVLPFWDRRVVVRRPYAFTRTEQERAKALLRACSAAQELAGSREVDKSGR